MTPAVSQAALQFNSNHRCKNVPEKNEKKNVKKPLKTWTRINV